MPSANGQSTSDVCRVPANAGARRPKKEECLSAGTGREDARHAPRTNHERRADRLRRTGQSGDELRRGGFPCHPVWGGGVKRSTGVREEVLFLSPAFRRKRGNINLGLSLCPSLCLSLCPSVRLSVCPSVRLSRFGFRALTALKIVRFHPNSVCKYTRTIVRISSKANAIRAYLRILIRLLNSHWLIGFRALTALKIV